MAKMLLGLWKIYKKGEIWKFCQRITRHEKREDDVYLIFGRPERKRCGYFVEKEKRKLNCIEGEH